MGYFILFFIFLAIINLSLDLCPYRNAVTNRQNNIGSRMLANLIICHAHWALYIYKHCMCFDVLLLNCSRKIPEEYIFCMSTDRNEI